MDSKSSLLSIQELIGAAKLNNFLSIIDDIKSGSTFQRGLPAFIDMEITKKCNLHCDMCWGAENKTIFPFEMFERSIEPLLDTAIECRFGGVGEPLTHPQFFDFVRLLSDHRVLFTFVTNGTLLSKKFVDRLMDSSLYQIQISLDAATEATYRSIRHANFEATIGNVRYLMSQIKARNRQDVVAGLAFVMMGRNLKEAPLFVKMAGELGIKLVVFNKGSGNYFFEHPEEDISTQPELVREMISECYEIAESYSINLCVLFDSGVPVPDNQQRKAKENLRHLHLESYLWSTLLSSKKPDSRIRCYRPYANLWMSAVGEIHPCCWYSHNLAKLDLQTPVDGLSLWNSPDYQILRRETATETNLICHLSTCPVYQKIDTDLPLALLNCYRKFYKHCSSDEKIFSGEISEEEIVKCFRTSSFFRVIYDPEGRPLFSDFFRPDFCKEYAIECRYDGTGALKKCHRYLPNECGSSADMHVPKHLALSRKLFDWLKGGRH